MCAKKRSRWGHIQTLVPGEKYRIFWPAGRDDNGKRSQPSAIVHGTWDDADYELARIHFQDQQLAPDVDRNITWGRFYNQVVRPTFADLATKTVNEYERVWRIELSPRIYDMRVRDTTWDAVSVVIASINAPSVQRKAHALWKKMCNIAIRKRLLVVNPVDAAVKMKPLIKREKHMIEADDLMKYLLSLRGSRYLPLVLMETTGLMRLEEASAICSTDITESKGYAVAHIDKALVSDDKKERNPTGKELKSTKNTHSERDAYFAHPFAELLLEATDGIEGAIMSARNPVGDEPNETWYANPRFVARNWANWCKNHGIPYVRLGDMRTICSNLHMEARTPDLAVALAMGHAEVDGTTRGQNYATRTPKTMRMVADSIAQYVMSESPCYAMLHEDA